LIKKKHRNSTEEFGDDGQDASYLKKSMGHLLKGKYVRDSMFCLSWIPSSLENFK
jgi:hypothetical protein